MASHRPPSSGPLAGTVLGRYRLLRLLGEGGMGAVYEATHQDLGRPAAIKTLHPRHAESENARSRFLREGQAASRIRHPNVADVYDVGIEEGQPYLVMELLEGETLARVIARDGPLSVQRTADILAPVVAAVAAVHDLGVVHRDLKPENIFLSAERTGVRPKVLDFGISKVINREEVTNLTDTGAFLGTPYYVSPEQARGAKNVDFRSDQYSLGVILYECVTSRRPIEESSLYAMIQRIVDGDFAPPRQFNPRLPSAVEGVILKAMARDPNDRFTTTRELGRALLQFTGADVGKSYADELSSGPQSWQTVRDPGAYGERPGSGTTLGESAVQRDAPRVTRTKWPWVGGGLLLATGIGMFAVSSQLAPSTANGGTRSPPSAAAAPRSTLVALPTPATASASAVATIALSSAAEPAVDLASARPSVRALRSFASGPSGNSPDSTKKKTAGAGSATTLPLSSNRFLDSRTF
jgi:eukaryotic-like serine/threonine-protein kinase